MRSLNLMTKDVHVVFPICLSDLVLTEFVLSPVCRRSDMQNPKQNPHVV